MLSVLKHKYQRLFTHYMTSNIYLGYSFSNLRKCFLCLCVCLFLFLMVVCLFGPLSTSPVDSDLR